MALLSAPARKYALFLAVSTLLLNACASREPAAPREIETYTVRGVMIDRPETPRPGSTILVRHEPIDNFVDIHGKTVGMDSMAMPFPIADPQIIEGLSPGDLIEMTFELDWDADKAPLQVITVVPLAPGTKLEFGKAQPPADGT